MQNNPNFIDIFIKIKERILYFARRSLPCKSMSVTKIVIARGKATAVMLLVMPLVIKAAPSSRTSFWKEPLRLKSVLNIL